MTCAEAATGDQRPPEVEDDSLMFDPWEMEHDVFGHGGALDGDGACGAASPCPVGPTTSHEGAPSAETARTTRCNARRCRGEAGLATDFTARAVRIMAEGARPCRGDAPSRMAALARRIKARAADKDGTGRLGDGEAEASAERDDASSNQPRRGFDDDHAPRPDGPGSGGRGAARGTHAARARDLEERREEEEEAARPAKRRCGGELGGAADGRRSEGPVDRNELIRRLRAAAMEPGGTDGLRQTSVCEGAGKQVGDALTWHGAEDGASGRPTADEAAPAGKRRRFGSHEEATATWDPGPRRRLRHGPQQQVQQQQPQPQQRRQMQQWGLQLRQADSGSSLQLGQSTARDPWLCPRGEGRGSAASDAHLRQDGRVNKSSMHDGGGVPKGGCHGGPSALRRAPRGAPEPGGALGAESGDCDAPRRVDLPRGGPARVPARRPDDGDHVDAADAAAATGAGVHGESMARVANRAQLLRLLAGDGGGAAESPMSTSATVVAGTAAEDATIRHPVQLAPRGTLLTPRRRVEQCGGRKRPRHAHCAARQHYGDLATDDASLDVGYGGVYSAATGSVPAASGDVGNGPAAGRGICPAVLLSVPGSGGAAPRPGVRRRLRDKQPPSHRAGREEEFASGHGDALRGEEIATADSGYEAHGRPPERGGPPCGSLP